MATYQPSPQDEGYSEAPLTIYDPALKPVWLANVPAPDRIEYVMSIINQLPTSEICELVRRVSPRIYIDFFHYLPMEVCLKILGYLDPISLLNTGRTSKSCMPLALDRKLWERLYRWEGFRANLAEVTDFEASLEAPHDDSVDRHHHKRRALPQHVLPSLSTNLDSEMTDIDSAGTELHVPYGSHQRRSHRVAAVWRPNNSLVALDRNDGSRRVNWHHLYTVRKRLEANWEAEKYTNFQLPHPNFPNEAHSECIYTIQHSGSHLVSGSRDHTLRVWDINTRRLILPPLRGHTGSVLCLQFDADPNEDIIVSGSSDSTVVIWKFSTGQLVQRLRRAHRESVLNVRFDKNVLVTCSKDKTIKIFNRRPIAVTEAGTPIFLPGKVLPDLGFAPAPAPFSGLSSRPAFTMIRCLEGHGAAVNAVQIYGDEIVSASGDRTVRMWTWTSGNCKKVMTGHHKGIACVQYDGRRIVSGSSDNEVKVFDSISGAAVATLKAHSNLVRTVQAGFGDLPDSIERDEEDARRTDADFFRAVDAGEVALDKKRSSYEHNGSRRPDNIMAYGAKLPPGGGGGRLGRIVSGSYDETIIIWRRDREGVWKARHRLRQESAASAAAREPPAQIPPPTPVATPFSAAPPDTPTTHGTPDFYRQVIVTAMSQGPAALQQALERYPELFQNNGLPDCLEMIQAQSNGSDNSMLNAYSQALRAFSELSSQSTGGAVPQTDTDQAPTVSPTPISAPNPTPPAHRPPHQMIPSNSMARVFKLQFDARRIICCSQTPVIVGWDFANGDEEIIEASRFFAPVE